jgi:hypothetical protein
MRQLNQFKMVELGVVYIDAGVITEIADQVFRLKVFGLMCYGYGAP